MKKHLRKCPLCDEKVKIISREGWSVDKEYAIICTNCDMSYGIYIDYWNGIAEMHFEPDLDWLIYCFNQHYRK